MNTQNTAPTGVVSSTEFGHLEKLMREFEEWAFVRDFDTTRSAREPQRYANERTQGAWQAWGHGTANWRDNRDIAVRLLRECERTLAMWSDVAPAVSLRDDLRKALGL
jgi:hypothetical protein